MSAIASGIASGLRSAAGRTALAAAALVALSGTAAAQQIESVAWTRPDYKIQGWVGPLDGHSGLVSTIDNAGRLVTYLPARRHIRGMTATLDIESTETLVPPPHVASVSSGKIIVDSTKYATGQGGTVDPQSRQDYDVVVPRELLLGLRNDRTFDFQVQHGSRNVRLSWSFRVYPGPYELERLRCDRMQDPSKQRGALRFRVELDEVVKNPQGELYGFQVAPSGPFDLSGLPMTPDQPALGPLYQALIPMGEQAVTIALPVADKSFSGQVSVSVNHMYGGWEIGADRYGPVYEAAVKNGMMLANGMDHYGECTITVPGKLPGTPSVGGAKKKMKTR